MFHILKPLRQHRELLIIFQACVCNTLIHTALNALTHAYNTLTPTVSWQHHFHHLSLAASFLMSLLVEATWSIHSLSQASTDQLNCKVNAHLENGITSEKGIEFLFLSALSRSPCCILLHQLFHCRLLRFGLKRVG